jgi:sterol desaturase/sphingolipid hydroxylase (fatty acid hydroxylase superfamily)
MFDQPWLERITRTHPAALPPIFLPPTAFLVWEGVSSGLSVEIVCALFACGLVGWTLVEYLMHRFGFHFVPRSRPGMIVAYLIHGVHHAFPDDDRRWVMPPAASVPIAVVSYLLVRALLGDIHAPIFAGLLAGYLWYDLTHYAIHRGPKASGIGGFLSRYHIQHHYATPDRHFGVTSPLWDRIFRTVK